MKEIVLFMLSAFVFTGCLAYESVEYRYKIDPKDNSGEVWVIYNGIGSTEDKEEDIKKDLIDLVEDQFLGDDFVIDAIEDGIAVLKRDLKVVNGKLRGEYYGVFKKLDLEYNNIVKNNGEYFFFIDENDGKVSSTNGKVISTDKNVIIVFREGKGEFRWRQETGDDVKFTSLADRFEKYMKEKE